MPSLQPDSVAPKEYLRPCLLPFWQEISSFTQKFRVKDLQIFIPHLAIFLHRSRYPQAFAKP